MQKHAWATTTSTLDHSATRRTTVANPTEDDMGNSKARKRKRLVNGARSPSRCAVRKVYFSRGDSGSGEVMDNGMKVLRRCVLMCVQDDVDIQSFERSGEQNSSWFVDQFLEMGLHHSVCAAVSAMKERAVIAVAAYSNLREVWLRVGWRLKYRHRNAALRIQRWVV
jgi:hypothetical protein